MSLDWDGGDRLQRCRVAVSMLNKLTRGWSSSWGLGEGPKIHHKKPTCYEMLPRALDLAGSCEYSNEP